MRDFICKILFFVSIFLIIFIAFNLIVSSYLNKSFDDPNAVFIWGDSQAVQGIHIPELSKILGKKVYTSAHHAASVYDFLIFSEQVNDNSEVIISISQLAQVRRKENDFSRSGLSIQALFKLYSNNYTIGEIYTIFKHNLLPTKNFVQPYLYAFSDSIHINIPLSHYQKYYKSIPSFIYDKQKLFLIGIRNLIKKNCKITFVEFPFHAKLKQIISNSVVNKLTENFKYKIISMFDKCEIDTIVLKNSKNIFHDYSHLNYLGALSITKKLGACIQQQKCVTYYIITE